MVARLILLIAVALLIVQSIDYLNFSVDDTFIPLRIAQNAANGNGLVYNIGDHVEGHSDPLLVVILAGISKLVGHQDNPMFLLWAAKAVSYFFGLCTLALLYLFTKKLFKGHPDANIYASLSVLALVCTGYFVLWMNAGLEVTMVAFFYLLATWLVSKNLELGTRNLELGTRNVEPGTWHLALAGVLSCATFVRPEAPLFAAFTFAFLFWRNKNQRFLLIAYCLLPFALGFSAFEFFRFSFYGDFLPNTYYAKTATSIGSLVNGAKYLLAAFAAVAGPLIIFLPWKIVKQTENREVRLFMLGMLACNAVFITYAGADWMPGYRFMLPVAPLLIITCLFNVDVLLNKISKRGVAEFGWSLVLGVALVSLATFTLSRSLIRGQATSMTSGFAVRTGHSQQEHQQVAEWLKQNLKEGQLVAAGEAGTIGYLNPRMVLLDMNGLMDKKIARDRKHKRPFDVDYTMGKNPDFFVMYTDRSRSSASVLGAESFYDMVMADARFEANYQPLVIFEMFSVYGRKQ